VEPFRLHFLVVCFLIVCVFVGCSSLPCRRLSSSTTASKCETTAGTQAARNELLCGWSNTGCGHCFDMSDIDDVRCVYVCRILPCMVQMRSQWRMWRMKKHSM
jgi:hypothetical protein